MPLSFPPNPTIGTTYTDSNYILWQFDGVKWNTILGPTEKLFNGAKIKLTTYVALTNTLSPISFDNEVFDIGSYYTSVDPTKIRIIQDGFYRINGSFAAGSTGTGSSYIIELRKNGNIILSSANMAANQTISYDNTIQLESGDYIQVYASEVNAIGTLLATSFIEIVQFGQTPGAGIRQFDMFSGVKAITSNVIYPTNTEAAINWTSTEWDTNADALGGLYWNISTPSRLTVRQNGFYEITSTLTTDSFGADNSFTIILKKNDTITLASISLSPNDTTTIDEIFELAESDYVEIYVSNIDSVGSINSTAFFKLTRLGVA